MILVCRNCGSLNSDPGGDLRRLRCGVCGQPQLQRVATKSEKVLAAGITGATVGGLTFGPIGALVGGVLALLIGDNQFK
jgi:hypothetical protein